MAAEALDFGFQFADALLQFRETIEGRDGLEPLAIVHRGITGEHGARGDVIGNAAFGGYDRAVANSEMASRADLAGKDAAIANFRGTGETDLSAKHGVRADLRGMTDGNEVVELGAVADARLADGGAVHASVGLNFDVILENSGAGLLHFVPRAVLLFRKAETVAADHRAALENDAVADLAELADDGVGVREEIVADAGSLINRDETMKNGVAADFDAIFDDAVRPDMRTVGDSRGLGDDGGGMNARGIARRLIEKLNGAGKGEIGIRRAQSGERRQAGFAFDRDAVLKENRGRPSGAEKREVAAIGEEGDLAGNGVLDSADAPDDGFGRPFEPAGKLLGNFGKWHGHKTAPGCWVRVSHSAKREVQTRLPETVGPLNAPAGVFRRVQQETSLG